MKKLIPFLATAVLLPTIALALDFTPEALYVDVRATSPEAAGITLLTHEGITQGYAGKHFGPTRQINRAEFLKIAMKSISKTAEYQAKDCFPDVRSTDWFSPFVCAAKDGGIVSGHADPSLPASQWKFDPADTVSYGEALKMLTLLYAYEVQPTGGSWAEQYYKAAAARGVDLPITIQFDKPLTRALAARLVGAFLSEENGQLETFRLAENGQYFPSSSSSSSTSSVSSSAVSSSVSSSSSSSVSSTAALFTVPSVSHFLLIGRTSDAIADGSIRSNGEPAHIVSAQVKLFTEARSVEYLELVTANGDFVAKLQRRITSDTTDYKQTYEVQLPAEAQVAIPKDTDVRLVLRAVIRSQENAGFSEELVQVRTISVTMRGDTTNTSSNIPLPAPFPKHQTAFGRIVSILRTSSGTATIPSGSAVSLSTFAFSGTAVAGRALSVNQLLFDVRQTGNITVSNWSIAKRGSASSFACSFNQEASIVTCSNVPESIGTIDPAKPLLLEVRADTVRGTGDVSLQVSLKNSGSPDTLGSVQWTDHSGQFRWTEGSSPLAQGTLWH